MRHYGIIALVLFLFSCAKDPSTLTGNDFLGADSTEAFATLDKVGGGKTLTVRKALARLAEHDSLEASKVMSIEKLVSNQTAWESYARPRLEMYSLAVEALKKRLKAPSTARIGAFDGLNNDSASIEFKEGDLAMFVGKYNAQNGFGVYLPGTFEAEFRNRDGKWGFKYGDEYGSDYLDFKVK